MITAPASLSTGVGEVRARSVVLLPSPVLPEPLPVLTIVASLEASVLIVVAPLSSPSVSIEAVVEADLTVQTRRWLETEGCCRRFLSGQQFLFVRRHPGQQGRGRGLGEVRGGREGHMLALILSSSLTPSNSQIYHIKYGDRVLYKSVRYLNIF